VPLYAGRECRPNAAELGARLGGGMMPISRPEECDGSSTRWVRPSGQGRRQHGSMRRTLTYITERF
jgi:hypothetical protein